MSDKKTLPPHSMSAARLLIRESGRAYRTPSDTPLSTPSPPLEFLYGPKGPVSQDPFLAGPYCVIENPYEFDSYSHPDEKFFGQLYRPEIKVFGQCGFHGTFPLVLIVHARPPGNFSTYYLAYSILARHLASHGFIVASMSRARNSSSNYDNIFGDLLEDTLYHFLNSDMSPIKNHVRTSSISVISHSSGAALMMENAHRVHSPQGNFHHGCDLNCFITLAPSGAYNTSLDDAFKHFLGLEIATDNDLHTYGYKEKYKPMLGIFYIYDKLGRSSMSAQSITVDKDLLFFDDTFPIPGGHFFQDRQFVSTYIAAFLQWRDNQLSGTYRDFFRRRKKSQGLMQALPTLQVRIQHEERDKIGIATFDESDGLYDHIESSKLLCIIGFPYILDDFSAHNSKTLQVYYDRTNQQNAAGPNTVKLVLKRNINIEEYQYLSFRIGQRYPGPKQTLNVRVWIGGSSSQLSNFSQDLQYPFVREVYVGELRNVTKNAMVTCILPLSAYAAADKQSVSSLVFDFTSNGITKATFDLDTIEFLP